MTQQDLSKHLEQPAIQRIQEDFRFADAVDSLSEMTPEEVELVAHLCLELRTSVGDGRQQLLQGMSLMLSAYGTMTGILMQIRDSLGMERYQPRETQEEGEQS